MKRDKKPDEVEFNIIVGKNIRYLRKINKLTQLELADAIGVAAQQVSKYEKGTNGMYSYILHKIAHKVFNISTDVLADPQMIIKHKGFSEMKHTYVYNLTHILNWKIEKADQLLTDPL